MNEKAAGMTKPMAMVRRMRGFTVAWSQAQPATTLPRVLVTPRADTWITVLGW